MLHYFTNMAHDFSARVEQHADLYNDSDGSGGVRTLA